MQKLSRDDLYSLEQYAELRPEFRRQVIEHKRHRKVPLGPDATLYFEDRLTMHYQIQEMLRVERIFERAGIEEELSAYNPLIPDGCNFKATFMLEINDEQERRQKLAQWVGIEDLVWVMVDGFEPVFAHADEDMDRATAEKTSSVHFLRLELSPQQAAAIKNGASISVGVSHPAYSHRVEPVSADIRDSLAADLD